MPHMHRYRQRSLPALVTALSLLASSAPAAAQAATQATTQAPGSDTVKAAPAAEPAPVTFTPPVVALPEAPAPTAAVARPIVHFVVKNANPNKGLVKLARYRGAIQAAVPAGNAVTLPTYFDVLCSEPCDVAVDVSERPMFFFIRDGHPVSHGFRLHNLEGHVTLKVKTLNRGLALAGAATLMFLVGIPLLIGAAPRVWLAKGRPGPGLAFKRVRRARL